jgi:hypothetical protein
MLTIFALPKAFRGHTEVIQTNAIYSWTKLRPSCEIILFGRDEGTAEMAAGLGLRHVPDVAQNEYGTPLVSSLFGMAQELAGNKIMAYVNSDIILAGDFMEAVRRIQKERFLLIGRRWDMDINEPLDFSQPDWDNRLLGLLNEYGRLHGRSGLDYFVFPRGMYRDIPPFAIGRTAWDNWLIYRARSLGVPVVEATGAVTIIHQNHDYAKFQTVGRDSVRGERKGVEGMRNRELLGSPYRSFNLWDATHTIASDGLRPTRSVRHLLWRLFRIPEMHPRLFPVNGIVSGLRAIAYRNMVIRGQYSRLLK